MSENEGLGAGGNVADGGFGPTAEHGEASEGEHDPVAEAFGRGHQRKRRRRRVVKMPGSEINSLNLTPMMDIMTILLVFLIQSFGVDPQNINVTLSLHPPSSTTDVMMEPATKVTITSEMILVDDVEVLPVQDLKIEKGKEIEIASVRDALLERADHLRAIERMGGAPFDGRLLVVAHDTTPYQIIMSVLFTAGQAKFGEYKLVVMKK